MTSAPPATAFVHSVPTIPLGEFDMGGVLYHANYFRLYEIVREALLSAGGFPYCDLVAKGLHLAVTESHQRFLKPVRYGEPIEIRLWTESVGRASFQFHYLFLCGEIVVHRALTRHVLVQVIGNSFSVATFPPRLREILHGTARSSGDQEISGT